MSQTITTLIEDYDQYRQGLNESDTQFGRRGYVRAAFATMEGLIDWIREHAINATCSDPANLNITRLELLGLEEYRISVNGTLSPTNRRTPFLNYTAFILRSLAEENGLDFGTYLSSDGWEKLRTSVRVRDRLTHPKTDTDLTVSDEEFAATEAAFLWLWNTMVGIFVEISEAFPELQQ